MHQPQINSKTNAKTLLILSGNLCIFVGSGMPPLGRAPQENRKAGPPTASLSVGSSQDRAGSGTGPGNFLPDAFD